MRKLFRASAPCHFCYQAYIKFLFVRSKKFFHKSGANSIFKISTKHQHFEFQPNFYFKILTIPSFKISTKDQLFNHTDSAAKYWLNFSYKISLELQPLDQPLCSKSEQNLAFMIKLQLPNLQQNVIKTFFIINISNSNNLNKFWIGIFTGQGHTKLNFTKQELVSQFLTSIANDWTQKGGQYAF